MRYKVGDEVLLKVAYVKNSGNDAVFEFLGVDGETYMICPHTSSIYKPDMTAEEAWEIAKNLFANYSNTELDDIFGKGWSFPKLMELTPHEAKARIEAWEAEKEIKVGDEVRLKRDPGDEYKFFITNKDGFEISGFSGFKGSVFSRRNIRLYEKTGRHIDIEGILKQIGGDE